MCDFIFVLNKVRESKRELKQNKMNTRPKTKQKENKVNIGRWQFGTTVCIISTTKNGTTHALVTLNHIAVTCRIFCIYINCNDILQTEFCSFKSIRYIGSMCFHFPNWLLDGSDLLSLKNAYKCMMFGFVLLSLTRCVS